MDFYKILHTLIKMVTGMYLTNFLCIFFKFCYLFSFSITGAKFKYSNPAIYIGSIVTITCLIITCVTYIVCYTSITMPKKAKHCVINTWFAMALLSFSYSIGIHQTENIQICQGVGLTLHYLSLCSLLWMAVSAR